MVEETYPVPVQPLWEALTVRDVMVQWYFDTIEEFEPRVGFETRFMVSTGEREFPHVWKVTEVRPNERLCYDWSFENYDGDSNTVFELREVEGGTRLRLTATVTRPFPADIPEFERQSGVDGWTFLLKTNLKTLLSP